MGIAIKAVHFLESVHLLVVERPEVSAGRVKSHPKRPLELRLELATMAGRSTGSRRIFTAVPSGSSHQTDTWRSVVQLHCGKACTRSVNLEMHMRTCAGAAVSSTPSHRGGAASSSSTPAHRGGAALTVLRRRIAFGGAAEVHSVDMRDRDQLAALGDAVLSLEPTMTAYRRRHQATKFQVAVYVMFRKAVDPTVVTQPPVTLRTTMAAVFPDGSPQLVETATHLLELIEVYEHHGSGWVFSSFASLQLTLWHLDPLRESAFVPLPKWIKDKHTVTNIVGTGDDCFKSAVLAGLHPVADNPRKMENYIDHASNYDFSTLTFPVPLSAVAPFAAKNKISIGDVQKVIYPLRVSDAVIPGKHVDLLLHEMGKIQHYSTIKDFSRLISGQLSSHGAVYCCKKCLHAYPSPELLVKH